MRLLAACSQGTSCYALSGRDETHFCARDKHFVQEAWYQHNHPLPLICCQRLII